MYRDGILLVPTDRVGMVIRQWHADCVHPGRSRLWVQLLRYFAFPDLKQARIICDKVKSQCETCQVTEGSVGPYKAHLSPHPIPPEPMACVAIDLLSLSEVTYEGRKYDTVVCCVDRHSGWIMAIPVLYKGLTSEKVAKIMLEKWVIFGIPREITSDRGSHFIGGWWRTICAILGIRTAYAQAYHHQANGRVENANMQILKRLRQLLADKGGSWVERLPCVLSVLNDMPNEFGHSPHSGKDMMRKRGKILCLSSPRMKLSWSIV